MRQDNGTPHVAGNCDGLTAVAPKGRFPEIIPVLNYRKLSQSFQ